MKTKSWLLFLLTILASLVTISSEATYEVPASPESEFLDIPGEEFLSKEEYLRKLQSKSGSSTTESTHVNIFQKLKESIGLTIIGFILICCAPVFIWKNEGRYVNELKKIDFAQNEAIVVDSGSSSDENIGRLVYFVGNVTVGSETLGFSDEDKLNVSLPLPRAVLLKRTCYIYQKMEQAQASTDKDFVGGGETRTVTYTSVEDWFPSPGPAQLPHLPDEVNERGLWDKLVSTSGSSLVSAPQVAPQGIPPQLMAMLGIPSNDPPNGFKVCDNTKVGEFVISQDVIMGNPREFLMDMQPVPEDYLPDFVEGMVKNGNILQSFETTPSNGDVKVVYEYVKDDFNCSFIVQQTSSAAMKTDLENGGKAYGIEQCKVVDESCFGQCDSDLGYIWLVRKGKHSKDEMIDMAKEEQSQMMKLLRIVCAVALIGGWVMLFSPFVTALSVLPILGKLGYFAVVLFGVVVGGTCFCTIGLVAYIRYRPLIAFGLLALAGTIWGIVAWRLDVAAKNGGGK